MRVSGLFSVLVASSLASGAVAATAELKIHITGTKIPSVAAFDLNSNGNLALPLGPVKGDDGDIVDTGKTVAVDGSKNCNVYVVAIDASVSPAQASGALQPGNAAGGECLIYVGSESPRKHK